MDWDDLAGKVTGPEGGLRYVRLGLVLVVLGVVAMAAVGFTPIVRFEDESLTYDMMAEDPDADTAFGVPNSHALGHARWSLVGAGLTMLMGIVLILEGRRVINLRRLLPWHAEARATSLYALAAMLATIGLFSGASLLGLAESMPSTSGGGVDVSLEASSPAAIVVVLTMGVATIGMLGMAYYNGVLSVYRGGGDPANRRMARFAMFLAFLSLASVLLLRVGVIMTAVLEFAAGPDIVIEMNWPYTMSRIDHQATLGAGEELKGRLSWQLTIASALLFMSFLAAMAGLIGGSARSLGGNSLRVRRSASMPAAGIPFIGIALLMLAWASATAPAAARDSWGMDDLKVTLGWGLMVGAVLGIGAIASSLGHVRILGVAFARESLAFWKGPEPSVETVDEGIPQPMVDQVLAEEARARGEFPPSEPEVVGPPLRERILLTNAKRNQIVIAAVLIIIIVLLAVLWPGGPGGGNGNGGSQTVVIEDLREFTWQVSFDEYLPEGDDLFIDPFVEIQYEPTAAIFVNTVTVTVTWTDEPANGILWTNNPDTFTARVDDNAGIDTAESSGSNPVGGQGSVTATWSSGAAWVVTGNPDLVDWGDQEVYRDVILHSGTSMDLAGDQESQFGVRTQADQGNTYTLSVTVSGRQYEQA